jgi:hypothetical protein
MSELTEIKSEHQSTDARILDDMMQALEAASATTVGWDANALVVFGALVDLNARSSKA